MIRLICPQCNAMLEMDSAFRGSVCRCSECGAMIKVPRKRTVADPTRPAPQRPEQPVDLPPGKVTAETENTNIEPELAELAPTGRGVLVVALLIALVVVAVLVYLGISYDLI